VDATNTKNFVFAGKGREDVGCRCDSVSCVEGYASCLGTWHYSSSVTGPHVFLSMLGVGLSINIGAKLCVGGSM
jgi:hypothetical protein